jgi:hypothetical protein
MLWEIDERAWLFIEPNAAQAAQRIEHEPVETYSSGVRHVNIPDPDGNAIAFAEPPDDVR